MGIARFFSFAAAAMFTVTVQAQTTAATLPAGAASTVTFHDPVYKLSFNYPAVWSFSQADGELSNFHLDARTAPPAAMMRAVVAMPENPFPASTFSGAYFYFSVTPHSSAGACERQAAPPQGGVGTADERIQIAGIPFTRGRDEQKTVCTTQRDEIYTTRRGGACFRFDLSINNFCGGEVSGVKDITPAELEQVRNRLGSILKTVRFDAK